MRVQARVHEGSQALQAAEAGGAQQQSGRVAEAGTVGIRHQTGVGREAEAKTARHHRACMYRARAAAGACSSARLLLEAHSFVHKSWFAGCAGG